MAAAVDQQLMRSPVDYHSMPWQRRALRPAALKARCCMTASCLLRACLFKCLSALMLLIFTITARWKPSCLPCIQVDTYDMVILEGGGQLREEVGRHACVCRQGGGGQASVRGAMLTRLPTHRALLAAVDIQQTAQLSALLAHDRGL